MTHFASNFAGGANIGSPLSSEFADSHRIGERVVRKEEINLLPRPGRLIEEILHRAWPPYRTEIFEDKLLYEAPQCLGYEVVEQHRGPETQSVPELEDVDNLLADPGIAELLLPKTSEEGV